LKDNPSSPVAEDSDDVAQNTVGKNGLAITVLDNALSCLGFELTNNDKSPEDSQGK
jgi:hypothetical protein